MICTAIAINHTMQWLPASVLLILAVGVQCQVQGSSEQVSQGDALPTLSNSAAPAAAAQVVATTMIFIKLVPSSKRTKVSCRHQPSQFKAAVYCSSLDCSHAAKSGATRCQGL